MVRHRTSSNGESDKVVATTGPRIIISRKKNLQDKLMNIFNVSICSFVLHVFKDGELANGLRLGSKHSI